MGAHHAILAGKEKHQPVICIECIGMLYISRMCNLLVHPISIKIDAVGKSIFSIMVYYYLFVFSDREKNCRKETHNSKY